MADTFIDEFYIYIETFSAEEEQDLLLAYSSAHKFLMVTDIVRRCDDRFSNLVNEGYCTLEKNELIYSFVKIIEIYPC